MDSSSTEELRWQAPGPGHWVLGRHVVRPLTPIMQAIHPPAFQAGFETGFARLGMPVRRLDEQMVNGAPFNRPVPLIDRPGAKPLPVPVLKVLTKLHPEFRRRNERARKTLDGQSWQLWVDRWHNQDSHVWTDRHMTLQSIDLSELEPEALQGHLDDTIKNAEAALRTHFELAPIESIAVAQLIVDGADLWGLTPGDVLAALEGASPGTTSMIRALAPLREELGGETIIRDLTDIREFSPAASQLLDDWFVKHGWWTLTGYDLDALTIGEIPSTMIAALKAAPMKTHDPTPVIGAFIENVPAGDETHARELLTAARKGHELRDAIGPCTGQWPLGLVRRAILEIGRRARFVKPGLAAEASQVELHEMTAGSPEPTESDLAARRQRRYDIGRMGIPTTLGEFEAPPPIDAMPKWLAKIARMGLAVMALEWGGSAEIKTDDHSTLRGQGIGATVVTGRARVLYEPTSELELEPGDILVAPCTTPTWSMLLVNAVGLVVEEGGLVAHSAIVARELEIPAVIGARGACHHLPDNAHIELDPVGGTVRVLDA